MHSTQAYTPERCAFGVFNSNHIHLCVCHKHTTGKDVLFVCHICTISVFAFNRYFCLHLVLLLGFVSLSRTSLQRSHGKSGLETDFSLLVTLTAIVFSMFKIAIRETDPGVVIKSVINMAVVYHFGVTNEAASFPV